MTKQSTSKNLKDTTQIKYIELSYILKKRQISKIYIEVCISEHRIKSVIESQISREFFANLWQVSITYSLTSQVRHKWSIGFQVFVHIILLLYQLSPRNAMKKDMKKNYMTNIISGS